jgi:hypothetical protein
LPPHVHRGYAEPAGQRYRRRPLRLQGFYLHEELVKAAQKAD